MPIERFLTLFTEPDAEKLLAQCVDCIRPQSPDDLHTARNNLTRLCETLDARPEIRCRLREAISKIQNIRWHNRLYTMTGILPNTGFFTELFRRIGHKFLPDVLDTDYLQRFVRRAFFRPSDHVWVSGLGEDAWLRLVEALRFDEETGEKECPHALSEMLHALQIISYWIAALGLEPELFRLAPDLAEYESPFTAQQAELNAYIAAYPTECRAAEHPGGIDDKHLRVLFDQCREVIARLHNRAARDGTSIRLTYILHRLCQLIQRCEHLLDVVEAYRTDPGGAVVQASLVRLFVRLVGAECQRDDIQSCWRRNTELIALRMTENASSHGEHYMTESLGDYLKMAKSALIGGSIIAFMAAFKLLIGKMELPLLVTMFLYCLNYGLGFCLIHILHGAVATKQPAMTANAIAASIEQAEGKLYHIETIAWLVARTVRTQMVAILGNILLAVPVSWLIADVYFRLNGHYLVSPEKAAFLLKQQSLTQSGAALYASIAGACLFLSGLINGYVDNYAAYGRVAERIMQLAWIRRVFGGYTAQRVAIYLGQNLGTLAGNLLFGFLLGGTTLVGVLTGLPIDNRHVTFSSSYVGFAATSFDFSWAAAFFDIAVIGFLNLAVSFTLAFHIALRARQVEEFPWRRIAKVTWEFLREHPREFFFPSGKS